MILDLFNISLVGVAKSVFSYMFVMLVWIIYMLVKKLGQANFYNRDQARTTFTSLVDLAMHGTIAGFVISIGLIFIGMPIQMSQYLLLLIPISLVLGMSNIRYLCIAYSASVLGLLALVFNGQLIGETAIPNIDIEVSGLIALVGALHVIEAILVFLYGHRDAIPIVSKKDDKILLGHVIQRYWPIPFAALVATTGALTGGAVEMPNWWPLLGKESMVLDAIIFLPMSMVGVIGYSTITFVQSPKKRVQMSGTLIGLYGLLLIALGYFSQGQIILEIIGIIAMAVLHEVVIKIELLYENSREPIYPLPKSGIRVMYVNIGGIGESMGLKIGDLIEKINDIEIVNLKHFKAIMKQQYSEVKLKVLDATNQAKELEYKTSDKAITALGIKMLPEKPPILFKASSMMKIGMVHLMKNRNIKK
jgi:hypothetical protein